MLFGNGMIHATDTALNERPKAFNGVGVNISAHVNLFRVRDSFMVVSGLAEKVIRSILVRVDRGRWHDTFDDMRHDRGALSILNGYGNDFSATLHHSENGLIVSVASGTPCYASLASASASANVGFIHFDRRRTVKGFYVVSHEIVANLLRDAVRGLIGHAKLALQLFRGYSATSACHQVHRVEPKVKRRGRLMKDGSSGRGKVLSTSLTRPSLTLLRVLVTLELALRFALRTLRVNTIIRVPITPEKVKTGVIVGKLAHKFHERLLRLGRFRSFRLFSIDWRHNGDIRTQFAYSVKG